MTRGLEVGLKDPLWAKWMQEISSEFDTRMSKVVLLHAPLSNFHRNYKQILYLLSQTLLSQTHMYVIRFILQVPMHQHVYAWREDVCKCISAGAVQSRSKRLPERGTHVIEVRPTALQPCSPVKSNHFFSGNLSGKMSVIKTSRRRRP